MVQKLKSTVIATLLFTASSAIAEYHTQAGQFHINLSGDAEFSVKKEDTKIDKDSTKESEINLYLDVMHQSGFKFHTTATAFDNKEEKDYNNRLTEESDAVISESYFVAPLIKRKLILVAGLKYDDQFGTEAFWNEDEYWRAIVAAPLTRSLKLAYMIKRADSSTDDSNTNLLRVDYKLAGFTLGARYVKVVKHKGVFRGPFYAREKDIHVGGAYAIGQVAGIDTAFEYKNVTGDGDGTGYYASLNKKFDFGLSLGLEYLHLKDGVDSGEDFAMSEILDKDISSSFTKKTSVLALPISYDITDKLRANFKWIKADILEESAKEYDLGLQYTFNKYATIGITYADMHGEGTRTLNDDRSDDYSSLEAKLTLKF